MSEAGGSLYEKVLRQLAETQRGASGGGGLPPVRPSAAGLPWRGRGGGLGGLWLRRAEALPFMGGWHAFPGGGLSRSDANIPVSGEPSGLGELPPAAGFPESLIEEPGPDLVPGLVAAALRELFEEIGILPTTLPP